MPTLVGMCQNYHSFSEIMFSHTDFSVVISVNIFQHVKIARLLLYAKSHCYTKFRHRKTKLDNHRWIIKKCVKFYLKILLDSWNTGQSQKEVTLYADDRDTNERHFVDIYWLEHNARNLITQCWSIISFLPLTYPTLATHESTILTAYNKKVTMKTQIQCSESVSNCID